MIVVSNDLEHMLKSPRYGTKDHFRTITTFHNIDLIVMSIYAPYNNRISFEKKQKIQKEIHIDRNRYRRLIIPLSDNKLSGRKNNDEPDDLTNKTHMLI